MSCYLASLGSKRQHLLSSYISLLMRETSPPGVTQLRCMHNVIFPSLATLLARAGPILVPAR